MDVASKDGNDVNNNETSVSSAQLPLSNVPNADELTNVEYSVTDIQNVEESVTFLASQIQKTADAQSDSDAFLDTDAQSRTPSLLNGVNANVDKMKDETEPVVVENQRGTVLRRILAFRENQLLNVSPVARLK